MTKKLRADILLLIITIFWGSSFPLMKMVLEYLPVYAYLSIRFMLATVLLLVIFHKRLRFITRRTIIYGSIIGVFMFAGMALQVNGLFTTSASNSGFITGLNVVIVPIISAFLLKKKPDRSSMIGILIAFIGLFFVFGGINLNLNIGDFLTFLCSICWAFQIIFNDRFTADEEAPLLAIMQIGFTGIVSTALWMTIDTKPMVINSTVIMILLITAVLGTALAFGGQVIAQKDTTPTHTALIFTAEPVFALFFAMIIPDINGQTETLGIIKAIGCLLILGGMLVSEFKIGRRKKDLVVNTFTGFD